MAIWQFDCYIIPKKNVTANIGLESEEILNWGNQSSTIEKIDFLEKQKSWSEKISQYGKIDETYIVYECEIAEDNMAMEEYEYENVNKYIAIEEIERNFMGKYDIRFSDIHPLKGQRIFNPYFS